jgi:hypothetical protein
LPGWTVATDARFARNGAQSAHGEALPDMTGAAWIRRPRQWLVLAGFGLCLLWPGLAAAVGDPYGSWYAFPESWEIQGWNINTSIHTSHFKPEEYHVNDQNLAGVEARFDRDWVIGAAVFDNSFGQESQFVYMGKSWYLGNSRHWYGKLRAGLLHGYDEPYDDKIPFNGLGIAPALIPALGFRYRWFRAEANLGGVSTLTITAGVSF